MIRRPPRSTRTDSLCPYTTLFRSTHTRGAKRRPVALGRPSMFSGRASSDVLAGLRFDLPQADRSRCRCLHLRVQRADPEEASGLAVAWERIVANLSLPHLTESIAGAVAAAQDKTQRTEERRVGKGCVSTGR